MRGPAAVVVGSVALALAVAAPASATSPPPPSHWFVQAAPANAPAGQGSRAHPFHSLDQVEQASAPEDRIVVLPAPRRLGPLDGGIELRPRQHLAGAGKRVIAAREPKRLAWITNTTDHIDGDGVRLARGSRVRNLKISSTGRGGVYGRNVGSVRVLGVDVSDHNLDCVPGFLIPPFNVPTTAPGVGIPISDGLQNGWAGIMVDADKGSSKVLFRRNRIHDAECGDGLDVRASGDARVHAKLLRNRVSSLRQGADFASLLALGLQSADDARLFARLDRNRERDLGNPTDAGVGPLGADAEGVFVNLSGPARARVTVDHNRYRNADALGGFSANGLEFVSMGEGSRGHVIVRNSSFERTPGDVIEQLALGTNGHLRMEMDNVSAGHSTGFGGTGNGNTILIPANNGDCLATASGGAGNAVQTRITDSELTDCANNGILFGSAVANGSGNTKLISLDVRRTKITGNLGANIRVGNLTGLGELRMLVQDSNLSDSRGETPTGLANVGFENLGTIRESQVDLGPGGLRSKGRNCITGGNFAINVIGLFVVSAEHNWWGNPAGPAPGRVIATPGSAIHTDDPLAQPPPSCDL